MNSVSRKLWHECVPEHYFGGFEEEIVEEIVSIGQRMGLEVDTDDVKGLEEDHSSEITIEHRYQEQQKGKAEDILSGEEEGKEKSSVIKQMCTKWEELQTFVEKNLPQ